MGTLDWLGDKRYFTAAAAIGASRKQDWFSQRLAKLLVARGVRERTQ